mgnify:CR=1 FL=1
MKKYKPQSLIAITGANGFVGSALCKELSFRKINHRRIQRKVEDNVFIIDSIGPNTQWSKTLKGVDILIHCAGITKRNNSNLQTDSILNDEINHQGTINLAKQAACEGVKRFIFLSSIKVNGESSYKTLFRNSDKVNPKDPYSISKQKAENGLKRIAKKGKMEIVIIRPPLIYGPGAKGNFKKLIKIINFGIPLPLKNIKNKKSFIYLGNLVDFIIKCTHYPLAPSQTLLISDDILISTRDLVEKIAFYLNKKIYIFYFPELFLTFALKVLGKKDYIDKFLGNLAIDNNYAYKTIKWKPPYTFDEGIKKTLTLK